MYIGALWSTIVYDYLIKISGKPDISNELIRQMPIPEPGLLLAPLLKRYLKLTCLTLDFRDIWEEQYDKRWIDDAWVLDIGSRNSTSDESKWSMDIPLRTDNERRLALIELDALGGIVVGLSIGQLTSMYRAQFSVLRKYEHNMYFDAHGRRIAKDHHAHGVRQEKGDWEAVSAYVESGGTADVNLRIYEPPFYKPDREHEMRVAYEEFQRRYGT